MELSNSKIRSDHDVLCQQNLIISSGWLAIGVHVGWVRAGNFNQAEAVDADLIDTMREKLGK